MDAVDGAGSIVVDTVGETATSTSVASSESKLCQLPLFV